MDDNATEIDAKQGTFGEISNAQQFFTLPLLPSRSVDHIVHMIRGIIESSDAESLDSSSADPTNTAQTSHSPS